MRSTPKLGPNNVHQCSIFPAVSTEEDRRKRQKPPIQRSLQHQINVRNRWAVVVETHFLAGFRDIWWQATGHHCSTLHTTPTVLYNPSGIVLHLTTKRRVKGLSDKESQQVSNSSI